MKSPEAPSAPFPPDAAKDDAPARHIRLTSHPSGGDAMPGSTPPVAWREPKRWPTTSAMSETSARAATAHGSTLARPPFAVAGAAPAGVPQR